MENLAPHEQVNQSSKWINEFFVHYQPTGHAPAVSWASNFQSQSSNVRPPVRTPNISRTPEKQMKPVNSWIAFRTYYVQLFPGMQQMQRSSSVLELWNFEPFKAKWAVIAKAYSSIRNQVGKDRAPLDDYLDIVCPRMGVIKPEEYFTVMGWTLEDGKTGSATFKQSAAPSLSGYSNSTISAKELIVYCAEMNYILHSVAAEIIGTRMMARNGGLPCVQAGQQDLFASAPALAESAKPEETLQTAIPDPLEIASQLSGFDFGTLLPANNQQPEAYQWTGSMADLYNPAEGSMDYGKLIQDQHDGPWDPQPLSDRFENGRT